MPAERCIPLLLPDGIFSHAVMPGSDDAAPPCSLLNLTVALPTAYLIQFFHLILPNLECGYLL